MMISLRLFLVSAILAATGELLKVLRSATNKILGKRRKLGFRKSGDLR